MADFLKVAKADEFLPGRHGGSEAAASGSPCSRTPAPIKVGLYLSVRTIAGDTPVARREVQHPNRSARPSRASRHRPLQRSANGDRYRDSGLAKAVECEQAEG